MGLNPAPTNRDRQSRELPSNILQVVKGFGLNREVSTVAGLSQGGVAIEGNGDRSCVNAVEPAEKFQRCKDSKNASKLAAKGRLIQEEPSGEIVPNNP